MSLYDPNNIYVVGPDGKRYRYVGSFDYNSGNGREQKIVVESVANGQTTNFFEWELEYE